MSDLLEERIRHELTAVRADTPSAAEIGRARSRARRERARHPRRRTAAAVATCTAAGAVAFAALPSGDPDGDRPLSAAGFLNATAAIAAERPARSLLGGFHYTEAVVRWTYGTSTASITIEQPHETWVGGRARGRETFGAGRVVERAGDPEMAARIEDQVFDEWYGEPRTQPYRSLGAIGRAPLADLPLDPDELGPLLERAFRGNVSWWRENVDPAMPDSEIRLYVARDILTALTERSLEPELRSALFGVLARMPYVTLQGAAEDERGRPGQAIEMAFPPAADEPMPDGRSGRVLGGSNAAKGERLRLIVDPETTAVLSWSTGKDVTFDPVTPENAKENAQLLVRTDVALGSDRAPLGQRP